MFACYRKDDANNPETYCAAAAAILGDGYSREIVDYVTDPRTGIPSRLKFLPTVAEIRDACDARAAFVDRLNRYDGLKPTAPAAPPPTLPGQVTYGQFIKNCEANGRKPRPVGAFERGGYIGGSDAE